MRTADVMAIVAAVDVRDMTCAQALAVVARAAASLVEGQSLDILYNTPDVQHDLMIWAKERGLRQAESGPDRLRWQQP